MAEPDVDGRERAKETVSTAESTYGSDKAGMVCGYVFRPGEPGRDLDPDGAARRLAAPAGESDAFLWLHFNLANTASLRWIDQHLMLPDAFREATAANSSTRVELADDVLLAVLNDVLFYAFDASSASTLTICVDPRVLVSARLTPLRSIDRLRASVRRGETFRSPVELLAHLLRDQAEVLVHIVRDTTTQVDVIEDKLLAQAVMAGRSKLGSLRRTLVRLQRLLAPEPAALFRLLNRPPAWIAQDDVRDLRQAAEELAAAVADSAALVERVRLLQEELAALVNEQTSRTLFVLTIVTVLALPMTIIPGFFGMNVGGVPFSASQHGFWTVVALVAGVAGAGAVWALTRRGR
jgi:zinc transporter